MHMAGRSGAGGVIGYPSLRSGALFLIVTFAFATIRDRGNNGRLSPMATWAGCSYSPPPAGADSAEFAAVMVLLSVRILCS